MYDNSINMLLEKLSSSPQESLCRGKTVQIQDRIGQNILLVLCPACVYPSVLFSFSFYLWTTLLEEFVCSVAVTEVNAFSRPFYFVK